jgi:hypothetical protein
MFDHLEQGLGNRRACVAALSMQRAAAQYECTSPAYGCGASTLSSQRLKWALPNLHPLHLRFVVDGMGNAKQNPLNPS